MRLLALKLSTLLTGFLMGVPLLPTCFICHQDKITKFSPTQGAVCSQVTITGTIYAGSSLVNPAVTFGNVPAQAQLRHKYFLPLPGQPDPLEIFATVPPGAKTSDIGVRIKGSGLTRGVDYTFRTPFTVTGSPEAPGVQFTSPNVTIEPGTPTTLTWEVSGTITQLVLSHGGFKLLNGEVVGATVQDLPVGTTSITVSPAATTTYTLTAYNSCVSSRRGAEITVTVLPPLMLTLNPSSVTLPPGQSQSITATINADLNKVPITCSTPPASKVTCMPPPNPIPSGETSTTLTISADPNAPTSTVSETVSVEAVDPPGTGMAFATIFVTIPALKLSLNPTTFALSPGQYQTVAATVTPSPTPGQTVQISCQPSTVLTCNMPTISSGNPASLVVTASPSVAPGTVIPPLVVTAAQVPPGPGTEKGTANLDVTFVQPPRQTGNFVAMSTVATETTTGMIAIGSCTVQVVPRSPSEPPYDPYDAKFTCGTKMAHEPFATTSTANGENFNLGGVGVSANSALAVVISDNSDADHEGAYVHFFPFTLPGLVAVGGLTMNDNFTTNPANVTFTAANTPTIYASPDASLIILTGLNPAPPSQAGAELLALFDISNPSQPRVIPSPSGTPQFGSSFTAQVEPATSAGHQYVSIHFDGSASAVLFEIY